MKNSLSTVIFFLLFFGACTDKNRSKNYINILKPNFDLTSKKLMDNGFSLAKGEGIDVPILEKHVGDSLIYYQFDNDIDENSKPTYLLCQFFIQRKDSLDFVSNFKNNYSLQCAMVIGKEITSLTVKNPQNKLYYKYSIHKVDSTKLDIVVHFEYPVFDNP